MSDGYTDLSKSGFYNKRRWKKLRKYVFENEPLCRECLKNNKVKTAFAIDHIVPIDIDSTDELKYGLDNLQPLCEYHHRKKTNDDKVKAERDKKLKRGKLIMDSLDEW